MSFETALKFLGQVEGGWSNDPADHGGATYKGVTQAAYNRWRRMHDQPFAEVRGITQEELEDFYREEYWNTAHCADIPEPLDTVVFDMAVNSGPVRAIRTLQLCLGLPSDGMWGSKTSAAVAGLPAYKVETVVKEYLDRRRDFYEDLVENDPTQSRFLEGWLNRIEALEKVAQA